jgi:DNA polymerase (family 10)
VLKGIESDIRADGSLDYPDELLARFDFVVASVHSRFRLDREAQTERIIRAVQSPYTTILGHMTGRQLLRRPGYAIDIEKVLATCVRPGWPSRLMPIRGDSISTGAGIAARSNWDAS